MYNTVELVCNTPFDGTSCVLSNAATTHKDYVRHYLVEVGSALLKILVNPDYAE